MIRIALDLELNVDGVNPTEDIIQLGYVIFDTESDFEVAYGDYIKIEKPLYPYIITLTGITQRDIDMKGVSLQEAYNNMLDRCKEHKVNFNQLIQWGSADDEELKMQLDNYRYEDYIGQDLKNYQEVVYSLPYKGETLELPKPMVKSNLEWRFGRASMNLKAVYQMYAGANGIARSGGLKKSMSRLKIPWKIWLEQVTPTCVRQRSAHNAVCDAINTVSVYRFFHNQLKIIHEKM